ncbi:MAG: NAD-dependent epimerase [Tuberibacillus sp.]
MENEPTSILITGCAGFIGFHLSKRLLAEGFHVVGIDNINDYYETSLKHDRLNILKKHPPFTFVKGSLENSELVQYVFDQYPFDVVVNLAAQAGVRYSLVHPHAYIQSNLVGFLNILESCKSHQVKHLLYASSSSVYGNNQDIPFSTKDRVDRPISLYAATKKANEEMAYTYSHLYNLPTTGLRFFTVYGPWGRPDMALFTFANAIVKALPIDVYNFGDMQRDFTYIDDAVEAIYRLIQKGPATDSNPPYKIYNIGNHHPVHLTDFIENLEKHLGKKAIKNLLPIQPGDVPVTFADTHELEEDIHFKPTTPVDEGIKKFVEWFKDYYGIA